MLEEFLKWLMANGGPAVGGFIAGFGLYLRADSQRAALDEYYRKRDDARADREAAQRDSMIRADVEASGAARDIAGAVMAMKTGLDALRSDIADLRRART